MNTNLQQRSLSKVEYYKGYKLSSNVLRCGMGGNFWEVKVLDEASNNKVYASTDEAHVIALNEAKLWIDGRI